MNTWHVLAPEFPPDSGGVGDYTAVLADALVSAGDAVHVWHPPSPVTPDVPRSPQLSMHVLPDRFGSRSRAAIAAALTATPGVVLVQYVPGAFGARGLNVPFCRWIAGLARGGADVRVMFHEPFFYFGLSRPWRNVLAVVQRAMAAILLRASTRVYYPTDTWTRLLARYGPQTAVEVLPIPATIPVDVAQPAVDAARSRRRGALVIGHFGTYGDHVAGQLRPIVLELLRRLPDARVLLVGGGSQEFARALPSGIRERVDSTGRTNGAEAAAALRSCDLLVQPYPDGVTTRRTSMMAALTTSIPVVTTGGPLTEPVWMQEAAVALAPPDDARAFGDLAVGLAGDPAARAALGARGRRLYDERFALGITIARMRR
ncbi:MAG TPA: glycosyltransferase family 4 protein [Vicinamibacterales bacterium]|nr:glycosyltransferase family 4 protein [Vicinamibacterales bacterium]